MPTVESELKRCLSWAAALAAALTAQGAAAQLKPPRNPPAAAPAPAAPAAAPAATESANPEKEAAGKLAAAGWLSLLDRRDWGRAWETTSSVFRNTVPLGAWMDAIPKVREPLGVFVERAPLQSNYKTQLEGRPNGEYVSVVFRSKFGDREVQEIVTTVREEDGKWRVTGYSTR
jgi:hypothetical protein